jgi:hypothetical protein
MPGAPCGFLLKQVPASFPFAFPQLFGKPGILSLFLIMVSEDQKTMGRSTYISWQNIWFQKILATQEPLA